MRASSTVVAVEVFSGEFLLVQFWIPEQRGDEPLARADKVAYRASCVTLLEDASGVIFYGIADVGRESAPVLLQPSINQDI